MGKLSFPSMPPVVLLVWSWTLVTVSPTMSPSMKVMLFPMPSSVWTWLAVRDPDSPRTSSTGEACTDIDGYMDYYNDPNRWSPCSVEDLTEYYNEIGAEEFGSSCMTLLDDDSDGETSTETPTDSPTDSPTTSSP